MKNITFQYNGYTGSAEVSIEDNCLFGQILHITDLITYEAETPSELEKAFEKAVDDYLETCKHIGKNPDREFTGSFNVRIGRELHRETSTAAIAGNTSINNIIVLALKEYFAEKTPAHRPGYTNQFTERASVDYNQLLAGSNTRLPVKTA